MGTEGSTVLEPLWHGLPNLDDGSPVSGSASCALPPRYEAVKSARDFTGKTLEHWGLLARFEDVALVVSELVTNAMRHGLPKESPEEAEPPIRLHLLHWPARLLCAVRDPSGEPPKAPPATPCGPEALAYGGFVECAESLDSGCGATAEAGEEHAGYVDFTAESGRGLCLVDCFSESWGWHPLGGALSGKVVWALFELDAG